MEATVECDVLPIRASNPVSSEDLLSALPIGVAVFGPDLRLLHHDLSRLDSISPPRADVGMSLRDLAWWAPDQHQADRLLSAAQNALGGQTTAFEGRYMCPSGREGTLAIRVAPFASHTGPDGVIVTAQDISEYARSRAADQTLIDELNHRVKNMLALVGSIVNLNLRRASDLADAQSRISERLSAYGRSQDLIFANRLENTELADVAATALAFFPSNRLTLDIGTCRLDPRSAMLMSLALHELGTNAVKYGAWSCDGGRVCLSASAHNEPGQDQKRLVMGWNESGGPAATAPEHKGFGTLLTRDILQSQLRGTVECHYTEAGFRWHLDGYLPRDISD